jgi:uncharacterized protein (TIGR03083 family)
MDAIRLAHDERADLAEFLSTLSPEQWEVESLCSGWRVGDVVAHVLSYDELDTRGLIRRFARGRFLIDRVNAVGVDDYADRAPAALLVLLTEHLRPRGLTPGFGGRIGLLDGLIHHQDIRRPLGEPREIPAERLHAALDFARIAPPIKAFWRIRGLRLVATDLGWTAGSGPVVQGPGEALLMAMAGRRGVVGELAGYGTSTLAARIGG